MKRSLLVTLLMATQVFAENCQTMESDCRETSNRCANEAKKSCTICRDIPLCQPIVVYDIFDNSGLGVGARADLLYMGYYNPILTYVANELDTGTDLSSDIYAPYANPQLGCDIALNYTMPCYRGYTFEIGWFHIIPKWSRTIAEEYLVPAHIFTISYSAPSVATINNNIAINFIDLILMKTIAFDASFSMGPYAGVLGGFMKGISTATFTTDSGYFFDRTATKATLTQNISFKGIGTKVGTSYDFKLWKGLSILGNISFNALYGFSNAKMRVNDNGTGLANGSSHYFNHHARTFFDSLLGLVWRTHFLDNCLYADLHIQWRYQSYPSGWWQLEAVTNDSMHELSMEGQGLQVGISFKF